MKSNRLLLIKRLLQENKNRNVLKDPPKTRGIFYLKCFFFCCGVCVLSFKTLAQSQITFTESKKKFADVKKGDIVTLDYDFINTGNQPLIIASYEVQCSCTSAEFPKQPIPPGQGGKITVKFDTKTVYERQDRIVEILSNAKNSPTKIRFKGYVEKVK